MMRDPAQAPVQVRHFVVRMLLLSLATALVVAVLAPASYLVASHGASRASATSLSGDIAADIAELAAREPVLWRYNVSKIVQATNAHGRRRDLAMVRVLDCAGEVQIAAEALGFDANATGPNAFGTVRTAGSVVAYVEVRIDMARHRAIAWRLGAAGGLLGLILAWALTYLPARVVRRQYQEVARAGVELRAAQAEVEASNAELEVRVETAVADVRALSERAVGVQEAERSRIARDLHDSLGQAISAQRLQLDRIRRDGPTDDAVERVAALNRQMVDDLRRAVQDLRPAALEERSLSDALTELAESVELHAGVVATTRLRGLDEVPTEVASVLYRVTQEALTNVQRHANAGEVSVRTARDGNVLELEVADDGHGGAAETSGHGLRFMRDRAEAAGGTLDVQSGPEGTRITLRVPVRG